MRRTLLSLSIAAAISLPVLVQANPLTDQGGDQTGVSGFLCLGRLFQGQPNEAALCI